MGEVSKPGPVVLPPAPQTREATGEARGLSFTLPGASECGFESRVPGWAASLAFQYEPVRYVSTLFSYCAEPADLNKAQKRELYRFASRDEKSQKEFFAKMLPRLSRNDAGEIASSLAYNKKLLGSSFMEPKVVAFLLECPGGKDFYHYVAVDHSDAFISAYPTFPDEDLGYSLLQEAAKIRAFPDKGVDTVLKAYGFSEDFVIGLLADVGALDYYDVQVVARRLLPEGENLEPEILALDPSLRFVSLIEPGWVENLIGEPNNVLVTRREAHWVSLISRYLDEHHGLPTKENVEKAYASIQKATEVNKDIFLFEGREIILLANNEVNEEGNPVFGTYALQEALGVSEEEGTCLRPAQNLTPAQARKKREEMLARLLDASYPFNLSLDTHGSDMQNGRINLGSGVIITVADLAYVMTERAKNNPDPDDPAMRDIIIADSCICYEFLKKVQKEVGKNGQAMPLVIPSTEFGLRAYGDSHSDYGSQFFDFLLKCRTIGDIIDSEPYEFLRTNPSVLVPDPENPKGPPLQIS